MAEPFANTINTPKNNIMIITGKSQNFLRSFKKAHNSLMIFIFAPYYVLVG